MTCALCLKELDLCDSHIVPEFLYTPGYDEKHRLAVAKRGASDSRFVQKGKREPLLCNFCERLLNREYEQPISREWNELVPDEVEGTLHQLEPADSKVFKLFHLSILWRASVAEASEWSKVSLGPEHNERLRVALLAGDPPPRAEYPLLGNVFVDKDTRIPCRGWVGMPTSARIGAARLYTFLYGGCTWHTAIASHPVVHPDNPFALSTAGRLVMPVFPIEAIATLDLGPQLHYAPER